MFFKAIFQHHVRGGWNTSTRYISWLRYFFLSQVNVTANKDVTWMGWGQMTQVPPDLGKQAEAWGGGGGKRSLGKATAFLASVGLEREFTSAKGRGDADRHSNLVYKSLSAKDTMVVTSQETSPCFQSRAADRTFSGELGHRLMIRWHSPEVSILLRGVTFISWF